MNQAQKIFQYMQEHGTITSMDAIREFGCMRLAARIADIKKEGHIVNRKLETVINRDGYKTSIAVYSLGGNQ